MLRDGSLNYTVVLIEYVCMFRSHQINQIKHLKDNMVSTSLLLKHLKDNMVSTSLLFLKWPT